MELDEKILDYIDGLLSAEEAEQVREKITTDGEWKAQYDSFLEMNTILTHTELLSPSSFIC
jgi:anti-sigma factor RsiW